MSELVVSRQPGPSPILPYAFDKQPPPYNPDVLQNTIGASENPEETEEEKIRRLQEEARRNRNQAEDCCFDCDDDIDVDCCLLFLRFFCNPCRLLCKALAECSDGCCECCANCIHECCESSTETSNGGGCCDDDNSPSGDGGCCDGGDDCDCDCNCCD